MTELSMHIYIYIATREREKEIVVSQNSCLVEVLDYENGPVWFRLF
jgi:hypothetical protein